MALMFYTSASLFLGVSAAFVALWHALALGLVILGGYEAYFRVQRAIRRRRPPKVVSTRVDELVSFAPQWVWVYGGLYYPLICFPAGLLLGSAEFWLFLLGGLCLWPLSVPICLLWPRRCPPQWRAYSPNNRATRLLAQIQRLDDGICCVPSLHAAHAAYASVFYPSPYALVVVPVLVCVSALFVKQHSIVDFPLGLAIGFGVGTLVKLHM